MPVHLYVSSAPQDQPAMECLLSILSPIKRRYALQIWHSAQLTPGSALEEERAGAHAAADLFVFLITKDFLASAVCIQDMQDAFRLPQHRGAPIIPILISSTHYESEPIASLQMLPRSRVPVALWPHPAAAWAEIARELEAAVAKLTGPPAHDTTVDGEALGREPRGASRARSVRWGVLLLGGPILLAALGYGVFRAVTPHGPGRPTATAPVDLGTPSILPQQKQLAMPAASRQVEPSPQTAALPASPKAEPPPATGADSCAAGINNVTCNKVTAQPGSSVIMNGHVTVGGKLQGKR